MLCPKPAHAVYRCRFVFNVESPSAAALNFYADLGFRLHVEEPAYPKSIEVPSRPLGPAETWH